MYCIKKFSNNIISFVDIRVWAFLLSIIISFVVYFNQQPINPDAIAQYFPNSWVYLTHGLKAALHAYRWPFYPILIGIVSRFTGLSLLHANFLLATILNSITVVAFITLVQTITKNRRVIIAAFLAILIFHSFNILRCNVIRGFGYWAFMLLSIICLLKFLRTQRWRYALLWAPLMVVATLFRVEGAFLLCFAPLVLLFKSSASWRKRFVLIVKAESFNVIVFLFLIMWALTTGDDRFHHLGRIADLSTQATQAFYLIQHNLVHHAKDLVAALFLVVSKLTQFSVDFVSTVSFIYFIFAIYGWCVSKKNADNDARKYLLLLMVLSLIPLLVFYFQGWDMSGRYYMAPALLLVVWVPFGLARMYEAYKNRERIFIAKKWVIFIVILILFLSGMSGFFKIFGPSKSYMVRGGEWVKNRASAADRIYTNDQTVAFYAGRLPWVKGTGNDNNLPIDQLKQQWQNYDYILLHIDRSSIVPEQQFLKSQQVVPLKVFHNRRRDKVVIYQNNRRNRQ